MNTFEKIVEMRGAFDMRNPNPSKNYGIHGMELRFVLKGPGGAVQFLVFTNMHLPHVHKELVRSEHAETCLAPMGVDIGYHSPTPQFDGQTLSREECPYIGGPCYTDGSALRADEMMPLFLSGGTEYVWRALEEEYNDRFTARAAMPRAGDGEGT